jgi:putative flippase GtrA
MHEAAHLTAAARVRLPPQAIFVRYVLFAALSTLVNLVTQEATFRLAPLMALELSILAGTAAGFLTRYVLEKKWVFLDPFTGYPEEARKLFLYGVFGVGTTLLFWAIEIAFWLIWQTAGAKYTGAVIGLSLGYLAKYFLDKHYVFTLRGV